MFLRRLVLVSFVLVAASQLPGCATPEVLVTAGSSVCFGANGKPLTNGHCEALSKVAESLNTPAMNARINEALK